MGKMINVKVGGMLEEKEEKKCSLLAGARNERKKKNMTCNSTDAPVSASVTSTSFTVTPTPVGRIISSSTRSSNSTRMKFLNSLSPPPQLNHFETYTSQSVITSMRRRRRVTRSSSSFFNTTTNPTSSSASSSSSPSSSASPAVYPFSLTRSLATSAPILIPLLFLLIVTMPVSGLANDILSKSPTPAVLFSYTPSSTDRTTVSSSPQESLHQTKTLENHHHHPHSASSTSPLSSHLAELPLSDQPIFTNGQQQASSGQQHQHTCYVCLPPDKTSRDAEEILSIFPEETRQHIPDCASFGSQHAKLFEFKCPPEYVGCLLRIHGKNESRSCGKLPLNDCKTVNSVEVCYCSGALCNGNRPEILLEETESDERLRSQLEEEKEERETRKIWQKGETDDEDLLGPHHLDIDGMQDDTGDFGSGSEPPPGLIPVYTSTAKPTLIPNIRPSTTVTSPPKSISGAPATTLFRLIPSAFRIPFTSITVFNSANIASLVPLLLLQFIHLRLWDLTSLQLNL